MPVEVDAVDTAAHCLHALERSGQRHTDKPRVDQPACHVSQQWRVLQVIDR